eukprot:gene6724-7433_t
MACYALLPLLLILFASSLSAYLLSKPWAHSVSVLHERPATTPDRRWSVLPVGKVECSYLSKLGVPRQATILPKNETLTEDGKVVTYKPLERGRIVLFPGFEDCIADLDGFDYIWIISWMHVNSGFKRKIRPQPVANAEKAVPQQVGLFSSRAPHRPNPIALSAVKVVHVDAVAGIIEVEGLDLLHDTPVLDIKPYIPAFDAFPEARAGWMDLIHSDYKKARVYGYQDIHSSRGARAARSGSRRRSVSSEDSHESSPNTTTTTTATATTANHSEEYIS